MFHAQHVFSWLSAHCIGEISRNVGKYLRHALLLFALLVATPDATVSRCFTPHMVLRRVASESFCESCETMWSSHPPMPREFFCRDETLLIGSAVWWFWRATPGGDQVSKPSIYIWYVYTPWKTHWCTIMFNKMHTCLDHWTPDQLPCP